MLIYDPRPGLKGNQTEVALERAGITCNKNGIPFDTEKPTACSGIRVGTAAITTRGLKEDDCREVGRLILDVLQALRRDPAGDAQVEMLVREQVQTLMSRFHLSRTLSPALPDFRTHAMNPCTPNPSSSTA